MTEQSESLESFSLADLKRACNRETKHYRGGLPSDPRFCLEIFHRALRRVAQDRPAAVPPDQEAARTVLVEIYTDFIEALINRNGLHNIQMEDVTQHVWMNFWSAVSRDGGPDFASLKAVLGYLKRVTYTTAIALQRAAWKHNRAASLEALAEEIGEGTVAVSTNTPFDEYIRRRARERCIELLSDPMERSIFYMSVGMGYPPREIASMLANKGVMLNGRAPVARSVSDLLERMYRRLARDPEIRDLLRSD